MPDVQGAQGAQQDGGDWFVESIDQVRSAAVDLHLALDRIVGQLESAAASRKGGASLLEVVHQLVEEDGRESRLGPTVTFRGFERAVTGYRAQTVRRLVDDDRLSFTEVARLIGVSRQMVARLYKSVPARPGSQVIQTPLT